MGPLYVTTVTSPATAVPDSGGQPYDLVDMPTLKDDLGLKGSDTDSDNFLARAITQVSALIAHYCNRVFPVEGLTDLIYIDQDPYPYQTPGGLDPLPTSRWPIAGLVYLASPTTQSTAVLLFPSTVGVAAGEPASHANLVPGTTVLSVVADVSITLSAAPILPINAGDTVLFGLSVAQTLAKGQLQSLGPNVDYTVQPQVGQLLRLNPFTGVVTTWEAVPVTIAYSAGYATIPPDLVMACLREITHRYQARGRDPMLREIDQPGALGRQTWWITGESKGGFMAQDILSILDRYRVPVAG